MKKIVASLIIALSMSSTLFAGNTGVGIAVDMGLGVTAQFNGNINAQIGNAGICADYLFIQNNIEPESKIGDNLSWYIGAGVGYFWSDWGRHNEKNKNDEKVDLRVPVGLDLDFAKQWDVYLQVIPSLRVGDNVDFGINGALGIRYFF